MKCEKGNALFLILIAVALFAALSYAVTNSGRGGSGIDKEQASLAASQITQYGASVATAVQRLKLINGCSNTDISFHYDSDGDGTLETDGSDDYYNNGSSTDCYVFDANGGGLSYWQPDTSWLSPTSGLTNTESWGDTVFAGEINVMDVGTNCSSGADTACRDLILYMPYLEKEICDEINHGFSIDTTSYTTEIAMNFAGNDTDKFVGVYPNSAYDAYIGDDDTKFAGKSHGCFYRGYYPGYNYYHVLIAR